MTYSEKVAGHYASYYSYVDDWASLKKYLSGKENYWYLTNRSDSSMVYTVEGHKFMHRFNSLGLRDTELSPSPDDSLNLIIGSGDSFTEGVGTDQDSTWLKFFERSLRKQERFKNIRTLNAGTAGGDVFFEYVELERLLKLFHPNVVILSVNSSDIDDIVIRGGRERFKPGGKLAFRKPPVWEPLYASSFVFRALLHSTTDIDWTFLSQKEKEIKRKEAVDSIETCVKRFSDLAGKKNFKLLVVFQPRELEIKSGNFPFDTLAEKLKPDTSLTVINLKNEFKRTGAITNQNSSQFFWPVDLHCNAGGYKIWGEIMADIFASDTSRY